jgi:hypothetical protein
LEALDGFVDFLSVAQYSAKPKVRRGIVGVELYGYAIMGLRRHWLTKVTQHFRGSHVGQEVAWSHTNYLQEEADSLAELSLPVSDGGKAATRVRVARHLLQDAVAEAFGFAKATGSQLLKGNGAALRYLPLAWCF